MINNLKQYPKSYKKFLEFSRDKILEHIDHNLNMDTQAVSRLLDCSVSSLKYGLLLEFLEKNSVNIKFFSNLGAHPFFWASVSDFVYHITVDIHAGTFEERNEKLFTAAFKMLEERPE